MIRRIRHAVLFALRRAFNGVAIDYRRASEWPQSLPSSWTGSAATVRFQAGPRGNQLEGLVAESRDELPLQVKENLEALSRTALRRADVLDYGCGNGAYRAFIAGYSATAEWAYVGADVNAGLIAFCRRQMPEARFEVAPRFESLPFEEKSFDVVFASGVFQCVEQPPDLLAEFHRVTRAWVLLSRIPVRKHAASGIYLQRVWHRWGREAHAIHVFNREALETMCSAAGFDIDWRDYGLAWFQVPGEDEPVADMQLLLRKREGRE